MTTYSVKEAYVTLQGEGAQTGRAAVFLRFAGCNLWSGLERDRAGAVCRFCDTDFIGTDGENGGKFRDATALADHVRKVWDMGEPQGGVPYVICTGGEPLLQLDPAAIAALTAPDSQRAAMLEAGRRYVETERSWESVAQRYKDIYARARARHALR